MEIKTVGLSQSVYPALLAEIANPPKNIFYIGHLPADQPCVAIVGSHRPTSYGKTVTERLAYDLAGCGVIIISGKVRSLGGGKWISR